MSHGKPIVAGARWCYDGVQSLEPRWLLAGASPTDYEQYMLELINRARANPTAEAARYAIDLNEGVPAGALISTTPKQPLAFNPFLVASARGHSQDMIAHDYFSHNSFDTGDDWDERNTAAGYFYDSVSGWGSGENLAWLGQTTGVPLLTPSTAQLHGNLFIDENYPNRSHRTNMMFDAFNEVGIGIVAGPYYDPGQNLDFNAVMATVDFAFNAGDVFLTGVAYSDTLDDEPLYKPGTGIGGLTIRAVRDSDGEVFWTTTFASGGYSLPISAGTYTVTAEGPGISNPFVTRGVVVEEQNVKLDFVAAPSTPQITGHVYDDLNGDGGYSAGEGIGGLKVTAMRTSGGPAASFSATTTADGEYSIVVSAGTYTVTVSGTYLDAPIVVQNIVVGQGPRTVDLLKPPPQLSGIVFSDLNLDGTYTVGEPVWPGVAVIATPTAGAAISATTATNGAYTMPVESGEYAVTASGPGLSSPITIQHVLVARKNVTVVFAVRPVANGSQPDTTPPTALFSGPKTVTSAAAFYKFTITYSDPSKVRRATIGSGDLLVTGPKSFKAVRPTFVSTKAKADASTIAVVYSFIPTGGKWTSALNGAYKVTLNAKQVSDTRGNMLRSALVLGSFVVNLKKTSKALRHQTELQGASSAVVAAYAPPGLFAATLIRRATADMF